MPYLTISEYLAYGGELENTAFSRMEFKARTLIDQHTAGRLKADTAYTEPVKRLTFELIGLLGHSDVASASYQPKVESEGNDGYSVKIASGTILSLEQAEKTKVELIEQYLTDVRNTAGELLLCRWA